MASASVSAPVAYNSPALSMHCGEIYCSEACEDFSINCATCTQGFNLLSCTLFIKHVKECIVTSIQEDTSKNSDYVIEKIFTPAVKSENIELDSTTDNHFDPLFSMKIEIEPAPDFTDPSSLEDVDLDSAEESELSAKKIKRRAMLSDLIEEYKKHPILWDVNLRKIATPSDKTFHFKQIQQAFNLKHKTDFTASKLRRDIVVLRDGYNWALKNDAKFERPPQLWYFNKMNFISGTKDNVKQELFDKKTADFKLEVSGDKDNSMSGNLHQLNRKDIVSDIIDQFKKNAILREAKPRSEQLEKERKDALDNIAIFINNRYQTEVDGKDVYKKFANLQNGFRKAMVANITLNVPIDLWYYHQLSGISESQSGEEESDCLISEKQTINDDDMTLGELKIELLANESHNGSQKNECLDKSQPSDRCGDDNDLECTDDDGKYPYSNGESDFFPTRKVVFAIIDEYKKKPCLWSNDLHQHTEYTERSAALRSITEAVNTKCNQTFSEETIRRKFCNLKTCYKRVLRNKENYERKHPNSQKKFPIFLYYFDQISFIGATYRESTLSSVCHIRKRLHKWSMDSTKNRELLTCMIEEYRKQTILWSTKYSRREFSARKNAYAEIAKVVNDKFLTQFTPEQISCQLRRLRSAYRTMVLRKQSRQRSSLWYSGLLSFIEEDPDDRGMAIVYKEESPDGNDRTSGETEERNKILAIIELYKAAPILWDTNHRAFRHRSAKSKVFETMTSTLNAEHNCQLTIKQLRRKILFLRSSYSRALPDKTAKSDQDKQPSKPFFYDQISFLEPFIRQDKNAPTMKADIASQSSEDFTFLTDNRPLMLSFIELYKEQRCLWDPKHKDIRDVTVQAEAYENIANMFLQNDRNLTKQQVLSAIGFLHATVSYQESSEVDEKPETTLERVWFYEHLKFLDEIPRISNKQCSHCNQHFRSIRQYVKHKIEIGENPFTCDICHKEFSSRNKYMYHRLTHREPLKCDQCDFQAYDKYNMKVHMRRHQGDTPYQCETCDKAFVTSTELKRHALKHTGEKAFVCYICGIKMASNSELYQHMKRHRNQRDHKCAVCGGAFYTPKGLRNHMAGHSDERNHICDVCGATFKRKMTLKQHKALHAEQKKHECKICGKHFAQKAGLYSHMKSH